MDMETRGEQHDDRQGLDPMPGALVGGVDAFSLAAHDDSPSANGSCVADAARRSNALAQAQTAVNARCDGHAQERQDSQPVDPAVAVVAQDVVARRQRARLDMRVGRLAGTNSVLSPAHLAESKWESCLPESRQRAPSVH